MRERTGIVLGLGAFLALAAFPVWHALGSDVERARPELERAREGPACVEDTVYMTANHQALLNRWRNAVVRDGEHLYVSATGAQHEMSLTGTCMRCHGAAEGFCDRCHDYAGVTVRCWDCHVSPEGEAP
jgi:hypothetical protein